MNRNDNSSSSWLHIDGSMKTNIQLGSGGGGGGRGSASGCGGAKEVVVVTVEQVQRRKTG